MGRSRRAGRCHIQRRGLGILTALDAGDLDAGLVWAGQVQGLIHDIPTCQQLVSRIVADASAIIRDRLSGFLTADLVDAA